MSVERVSKSSFQAAEKEGEKREKSSQTINPKNFAARNGANPLLMQCKGACPASDFGTVVDARQSQYLNCGLLFASLVDQTVDGVINEVRAGFGEHNSHPLYRHSPRNDGKKSASLHVESLHLKDHLTCLAHRCNVLRIVARRGCEDGGMEGKSSTSMTDKGENQPDDCCGDGRRDDCSTLSGKDDGEDRIVDSGRDEGRDEMWLGDCAKSSRIEESSRLCYILAAADPILILLDSTACISAEKARAWFHHAGYIVRDSDE
ncbi:hypothetical protein B0H14DRAFT_2652743 [Mycena olivaceomarginata]|nr:hypothetical protein B0H14DRAFT_2652743 [Mycena olivaceomarginata]